jgi:MerR family copper efflux transcriptional regulator
MTPKSPPGSAERVHLYQIGEVAETIGLSLRTIRHYEEVGVVVPSGRSPGGFRLYTDSDIERLRRVMGMKPIGFSLEEIRDVLDLLDASEAAEPSPEVFDRLRMFAALAVERREKYRTRLHLGEAFTDELVTRAEQGPSRT